jgi:hypothetical protein
MPLHQVSNNKVAGVGRQENCRCDIHSCGDDSGEMDNTLVGAHNPCSVVVVRFANWGDNQAMAVVVVLGLAKGETGYALH